MLLPRVILMILAIDIAACDGDSTYFCRHIEELFSNLLKIKTIFC